MEAQGRKLVGFYDSYRDALRDDCKAIADYSAGWAKTIGRILFPEIADPMEASRRLNDKTNPNREDRLSDDQERLIMRLAVQKRGFSAAHDFVTDDISMERSKAAKDPHDEALDLQARAERTLAELRHLMERQERLAASPLAFVSKKSTG